MSTFLKDVANVIKEEFGWNVNKDELLQMFDSLASIVNKHNLYVNNSDNVEAFTKNYVVEQTYKH